jgi:putative transposase
MERKYSMERFYEVIGGSRQNFHQRRCKQVNKEQMEKGILEQVHLWRQDHPAMGSRALYKSMQEAGEDLPLGVTSFEQLLSRHGLTVGKMKKSFPQTSDGKAKRGYPNLANGLILNNINQLVVTDITYFWVADRWYYLFILKDVYSQHLLSLLPCEDMQAGNVLRMLQDLEQARKRVNLQGCIYHSDNGSQFESKDVLGYLDSMKMRVSRAASCEQNGSCEQMNHIVKNMYLRHFNSSHLSCH